jgi:hypothetical protein
MTNVNKKNYNYKKNQFIPTSSIFNNDAINR